MKTEAVRVTSQTWVSRWRASNQHKRLSSEPVPLALTSSSAPLSSSVCQVQNSLVSIKLSPVINKHITDVEFISPGDSCFLSPSQHTADVEKYCDDLWSDTIHYKYLQLSFSNSLPKVIGEARLYQEPTPWLCVLTPAQPVSISPFLLIPLLPLTSKVPLSPILNFRTPILPSSSSFVKSASESMSHRVTLVTVWKPTMNCKTTFKYTLFLLLVLPQVKYRWSSCVGGSCILPLTLWRCWCPGYRTYCELSLASLIFMC